jgi:type I restriction enzyme M protein
MTRLGQKMRRSLGSKRKEILDDDISLIVRLFREARTVNLVVLTDADGNEVRHVLDADAPPPSAPPNGKVKIFPLAKVFPTTAFGYRQITVDRPLLDDQGRPLRVAKGKAKGQPMPDPDRRDTERVPLDETIDAYMAREVLPHAPDAWVDPEKTRIGYEIPFTRHFFVAEPPRPLAEIDADLKATSERIRTLLREIGI